MAKHDILDENGFHWTAGAIPGKANEPTSPSNGTDIDRSDSADAARFRWLLDGHGYYMEENFLCGHAPTSEAEKDVARVEIDTAMAEK